MSRHIDTSLTHPREADEANMTIPEYRKYLNKNKFKPAKGIVMRGDYQWIPSSVRFDRSVKIMTPIHGLPRIKENIPIYKSLEEVSGIFDHCR